ncbi:hypothetical protein [Reyranella sp. CPCC 100927]|uniref:hypothetical protein n=1 Tax=Reyranella sp. CPCC 100927 TaxID=2599616 RepID=UPI0011B7CC1A|nr:hypothetical protein [Reyranella sp. CPCC 100927]TWT00244.1 hypothetical protein FQU96_33490 [Reyranella sp. CPCC 100927]
MQRTALIVLVLFLGIGRTAGAQTVESVLRDAGILGTWAEVCTMAAGERGNTRTIYARAANGTVTLTYDNGPRSTPTVYTILKAERRGADRIAYLQENQSDRRQLDIELRQAGERIKVWSSRRTTGEVLVAEGKFVAGGNDSPWQVRCRN